MTGSGTTRLSEVQVKALTELINVSIGIAAKSLSEIVNTQIALDIPELDVFSPGDRDHLDSIFGVDSSYAIVKQDFRGNLTGTTALAFSNESAANLVSLLTDALVTEEELDIMQTGTLLEVGNIINNAFLGTLNNQFNFRVNYKLPEFSEIQISHLFDTTFGADQDGLVIVANAKISVKVKHIEGYLILLFRVSDLDYLRQRLDMIAGEQ